MLSNPTDAPENRPAPSGLAPIIDEPSHPSVSDDRAAVLVVEDNEDTRMLLERMLAPSFRVHIAATARAALEVMNRERLSALVLDINLGGKQTGIDVLRVARTLPGCAAIFAVAVTAYALPGDRERFLEAGFDRYVSKPFTRTSLMAALGELLAVSP